MAHFFRFDMPSHERDSNSKANLRTAAYCIALWLVSSCLIIGLFVRSELIDRRADFNKQAESTYELIRQRLDQNEAVLGGLDALFNTFHKLKFDDIRGYAREMIGRYPHIYAIELQPKVESADVSTFEAWAKTHIYSDYRIKDFGFGDARTWRSAPFRKVYYPITFMEPSIEAAKPILGLDVYADPKFKAAIDTTIESGLPAVSAPFDLLEGGRGYLIFKAIYGTQQPLGSKQLRHQQATQVVSLLIHTQKFLARNELPSSNMSLLLFHNAYAQDDTKGYIDRLDAKPLDAISRVLFPEFEFRKSIPNPAQPFELVIKKQIGWEVIKPLSTGLVIAGSFTISLLVFFILLQRRRSIDVTREAELRLQAEKERGYVTLSSITDAVLTTNADGVIEYLNPAAEQILNVTIKDALRKSIHSLFHLQIDLEQQSDADLLSTLIAAETVAPFPEHCLLIKDTEQPRLVEGTSSPLFDTLAKKIGVVITFRDMGPVRLQAMAALEASEQRLREHQRELAHVSRLSTMGEMASGLAHELNQPLTAILSYNQACMRLLSEDNPDLEEAISAMKSTSLQAKRAGEIITRLRAFVSKQTADLTGLDLRQVVSNSLVLIGPDLRANNIEITCHLPDEMPLVMADSIQLEQVLMNLIRNAMDSLIDGKHITRQIDVSISWLNSSATMVVQDTGSGIAQEALEHLFHPFFTTKSTGMGLGLTICQSIIESFSGSLTVSNNTIGAEFICTLPIQKLSEAIHA